jgi:hypothetical protein
MNIDENEEVYKNAFENYEISNLGNVRRKLLNGNYQILKCSINNRGYKYFQINRQGKRKNFHIHVLLALAFLGENNGNQVIDHIDRNKLNNCPSNLRYCSQKENCMNQKRYVHEIKETDLVLRKSLIAKRYVKLNRDKVLQNKREYYIKNKDRINNMYKNERYNINCSICKNDRLVTRSRYNVIKKIGTENNKCLLCSAKINLTYSKCLK